MEALLVGGELFLIDGMTYQLRKIGFDAVAAGSPSTAMAALDRNVPDLVVIVAESVAAWTPTALAGLRRSDKPLILIGDPTDKRHADVASAVLPDEILTLPLAPALLTRRVELLTWRKCGQRVPPPTPAVVGDLVVDPLRFEVRTPTRREPLTLREVEVLYCMALHAGEYLTPAKLTACVWLLPETAKTRSVLRSCISLLRTKVEDDPRNPRHLLTKPSVGYALRAI